METARRNKKRNSLIKLFAGIAIIILINIISNYLFHRFDLTAEKRYTLAPSTKKMLKDLDDVVYVKVYLEGEFPAGFKRLRNETREMLNQFRAYTDNVRYEFINPSASSNQDEREALYKQLYEAGLNPTDVKSKNESGVSSQLIFPGAIVSFKGKDLPVQLLNEQVGIPSGEVLNNSIENLEYAFANAIHKLSSDVKPGIGFIRGQSELSDIYINDIANALSEFYSVEPVDINGKLDALTTRRHDKNDSTQYVIVNKYKAIIIAKPDSAFSEKDKFIVDQFLMRGGKILWFIDPVAVSIDSLQHQDQTVAIARDLRLDDLFFNCGLRLNYNLVLDLNALPIPVVTGKVGNQPKTEFFPWYFFPVITPVSSQPIVRNMNAVKFEFVSTIDTLERPGIKKTILMQSSSRTRVIDVPALISLKMLYSEPDPAKFNHPQQAVAVLVEGTFNSLFLNRLTPEISEAPEIGFKERSEPTQMIVVSDGDFIKNQVQSTPNGPVSLPCGYDRYTRQQFGNRDFVLNAINYLCDDNNLLTVRNRDIKLRLLDKTKIDENKTIWQVFNVVVPVLMIIIFALIQAWMRKRKYSKQFTSGFEFFYFRFWEKG